MNSETVKHWGFKPLFAVSLMAGTAAMLQSCSDDLLTGQPSWLGNSIYERLQEEGGYSTTLKLIDDLGQHDVMAQTGSKTLFAAHDTAFQSWFKTNSWGVRSYEQLSTAQKKLLLNTSMVNNAYLIELLSNVSGNPPETGKCMRRETAVSIYDTVTVVTPDLMPNTADWKKYKDASKNVVLLKDNTAQPMIHLLPAFMQLNKITDEDVSYLTNGEAQSINEAYVNGKKVVERDITCKNGYIHKVEGVIEPAPNMAELIRKNPKTKGWSKLLDRFSAPYYDDAATKEYNRLNQKQDSVFVLRYFSDVAKGGEKLNTNPDGEKVSATLSFDPGWNQYMYTNTMGYDLHYDAGAMLVPSDDALNNWWENSALRRQYHKWDSVPDLVLSKLIRVNMLDNFTENVPSKFGNILNDAKVEMGVNPAQHLVESNMACNGVVYVVNKVFAPSAYSSVSFPALIDQETFSIIYWAIDQLEFDPYLGSMDSKYGLLLPTNDALQHYIDPINYGENQNTYLKFTYDELEKEVKAERWTFDWNEDGTPNFEGGVRLQANVTSEIIKDRLEDLLDQCIIVLDPDDSDVPNKVSAIDASHTYYKTKGGSTIKVTVNGGYNFQAGYQLERGTAMKVAQNDVILAENGWSYSVSDGMPAGASQNVYNVLKNQDEYKLFYELLDGGDPDSSSQNMLVASISKDKYTCPNSAGGNLNMRLFDNYNYTIYIPTNASIQKLIDDGYLPTWNDFDTYYQKADNATTDEERTKYEKACYIIKNRINSFIRYHVQDNSVAIGGQEVTDVAYESMMRNPVTNRFYPLNVTSTGSSLKVVDAMGQARNVTMKNGLYNTICREYWLSGKLNNRQIYQASDAIIHQIDQPLMYEKLTKWQDEINQ